MQFLTDLSNHIEQLEAAANRSYAALMPRLLATIKVDPWVSACIGSAGLLVGFLIGHKV